MDMKKTLNEEVSRIKGMMGLNEARKHTYNEWFGGIGGRGFNEIDWDQPSEKALEQAYNNPEGGQMVQVYGRGDTIPEVGVERFRGYAPVKKGTGDDGDYLYADTDEVTDVEEDTDWEPSDDQMANYGNTEGGIGYSNPPAWNGR